MARIIACRALVDAEARRCEALQHDASVYDVPVLVERAGSPKLPDVFGPPDVLMMDLAVATTVQPATPWIAAQAKPWPGRLNVLRLQGGTSYAFNSVVGAQATMGELLSALPAGIIGRVDYQHALDVVLDFGALSSATREELLSGANLVAVGSELDGYEILQFESAELTGNNTYRLRGLLRAQSGSFAEMLPLRIAGQRFVLMNGAVLQVQSTLSESVLPSIWRIGPANLDHGHPAYVTAVVPPTLKALRPLRPVHVRAKPAVGGVLISWTRQTRHGGDAWEIENVPLSEDSERYQLQVMNGANVGRSWSTSAPQQFYSSAEMLADFGAPPATLSLRVAQVSASFGAGTILEGIVNV